MDASSKTCKVCGVAKCLDDFEVTTKDGRSRRHVCKPCYYVKKAEQARVAAHSHSPETTPKPVACSACGKGPDEVEFKWRSDVKKGSWRTQCNACYNAKGYCEKSRAKRLAEDPEGYRRANAETHLQWAHANRDKVRAQQAKSAADPSRRFKALLTYVRGKHGKDNVDDVVLLADADKLQAKMAEPCHYCGHTPEEGAALNGLDRVDPRGKYSDANTVPACGVCNAMKLTFHTDEFLQGVRDVVLFCGQVTNGRRPPALGGTAARRESEKDKSNDLDLETRLEILCNKCYLCGRAPALGIDRVDATKNYAPENCKPCCTLCNYMKKDWSLEEFLAHVTRIFLHTRHWVLGDASNILNGVSGPRKPVAPIGEDGRPLLIFPSMSCVVHLVGLDPKSLNSAVYGEAVCCGYKWSEVSAAAYKVQSKPSHEVKELILRLKDKKKRKRVLV